MSSPLLLDEPLAYLRLAITALSEAVLPSRVNAVMVSVDVEALRTKVWSAEPADDTVVSGTPPRPKAVSNNLDVSLLELRAFTNLREGIYRERLATMLMGLPAPAARSRASDEQVYRGRVLQTALRAAASFAWDPQVRALFLCVNSRGLTVSVGGGALGDSAEVWTKCNLDRWELDLYGNAGALHSVCLDYCRFTNAEVVSLLLAKDRRCLERAHIPNSCSHNCTKPAMAALEGCRWCAGSGRVELETDEYDGWNGCCCRCADCRELAEQLAEKDLRPEGEPSPSAASTTEGEGP